MFSGHTLWKSVYQRRKTVTLLVFFKNLNWHFWMLKGVVPLVFSTSPCLICQSTNRQYIIGKNMLNQGNVQVCLLPHPHNVQFGKVITLLKELETQDKRPYPAGECSRCWWSLWPRTFNLASTEAFFRASLLRYCSTLSSWSGRCSIPATLWTAVATASRSVSFMVTKQGGSLHLSY